MIKFVVILPFDESKKGDWPSKKSVLERGEATVGVLRGLQGKREELPVAFDM